MKQIDHIGIAVNDIESSKRVYEKLLGVKVFKEEEVESEKVLVSFLKCGDSKIELLSATSSESTIAKHIEKRGEGIHHIAFEVVNIYSEIKRLKEEGFEFIDENPKKGADNKLVVFVFPKSTGGVLIEICQEIK